MSGWVADAAAPSWAAPNHSLGGAALLAAGETYAYCAKRNWHSSPRGPPQAVSVHYRTCSAENPHGPEEKHSSSSPRTFYMSAQNDSSRLVTEQTCPLCPHQGTRVKSYSITHITQTDLYQNQPGYQISTSTHHKHKVLGQHWHGLNCMGEAWLFSMRWSLPW